MADLANADFRKIAFNPKERRVRISYQVENGTEEPDEYHVSVRQPPHPDLVARLEAMRPHVITLCEMDGLEPGQLEVRSVTITWKHGVMGAVITALRELRRSPAPLVLNTPHKTEDFYGEEGDPDQLLPGAAIAAIRDLIDEAKLFLGGKRGEAEEEPQQDLFEEVQGEEAGELVGAGMED